MLWGHFDAGSFGRCTERSPTGFYVEKETLLRAATWTKILNLNARMFGWSDNWLVLTSQEWIHMDDKSTWTKTSWVHEEKANTYREVVRSLQPALQLLWSILMCSLDHNLKGKFARIGFLKMVIRMMTSCLGSKEKGYFQVTSCLGK